MTSLTETKKAVVQLKSNKNPGSDNRTTELILFGGDQIHEAMKTIVKKIWKSGALLKEWKEGIL